MHEAYVNKAVEGELARLRQAQPGVRNVTLFQVAARLYQFVEAGAIAEEQLTSDLVVAAQAAGLRAPEVQATLRSAHRHALGRPLVPSPTGRGRRTSFAMPITLTPPDEANPPTDTWQNYAAGFCDVAQRLLWQPEGRRAQHWLRQRGLRDETLRQAGLGYNPTGFRDDRADWGLAPEERDGRAVRVWVPAGIVIPWQVAGQVWRVFVRRLLSAAQEQAGEQRYIQIPGGTNALYNADALAPEKPAMLVEGAFDALVVQQEAGDLVAAVASGTTGARRLRWIGAVTLCRPVLLSFDADAGGQEACAYWQSVLGDVARPWWPTHDDPAAMLTQGIDVRVWVESGLAMSTTVNVEG